MTVGPSGNTLSSPLLMKFSVDAQLSQENRWLIQVVEGGRQVEEWVRRVEADKSQCAANPRSTSNASLGSSHGGALSNRLRFPLAALAAVRQAVGESVPILVKFNLGDGFRGGLGLAEAVAASRS